MGLNNLLATMERRATDTPDTSCNRGEVSAKPAPIQACTLDTPDTLQNNVAANEPANDGEFTDDRQPDTSLPVAAELMQSAASVGAADPFDHEAFEERAAIMEFDGGLPRAEAERQAALLQRGADLPEPATAENEYPEFDEEALHLAWVYHFAEQEPETAVFMCAVNHRQALAFHPRAIAAIPRTVADGVSCKTCLHCSRPGGWPAPALCGGRTDLPPAFGDNHPLRILPEDGGKDCNKFKERNNS